MVVLSDLLDLPEGALEAVVTLAGRGRVLVVVQVLLIGPDRIRRVKHRGSWIQAGFFVVVMRT